VQAVQAMQVVVAQQVLRAQLVLPLVVPVALTLMAVVVAEVLTASTYPHLVV